jgi:hypothetical protein
MLAYKGDPMLDDSDSEPSVDKENNVDYESSPGPKI